jgi:hypothetical protein
MDITPHVNLLRSLRRERIDCNSPLVGEAIDHAFDVGANSFAARSGRTESKTPCSSYADDDGSEMGPVDDMKDPGTPIARAPGGRTVTGIECTVPAR